MPLFYEHINEVAKIAIWHIAEEKKFFLSKVPRHKQITHPRKQLQHLAGRYLLQYLYKDFPYDLIKIADTKKPFLPEEDFHFSISHCGDYAAAIVSRKHRVGIDIELFSEKAEKIKHKFLNAEEITTFQNPKCKIQKLKMQNFTLLWCCKEAVFKWYGNGGVDFKKHIHLKESDADKQVIVAEFLKENFTRLTLHYKIFDTLCMAWVGS